MLPFADNLASQYVHVEIPDLFPSFRKDRDRIAPRGSWPRLSNPALQTHMKLANSTVGDSQNSLESLKSKSRCRLVKFFRFRVSAIRWALLFKDSISGTEELVKLPDSQVN